MYESLQSQSNSGTATLDRPGAQQQSDQNNSLSQKTQDLSTSQLKRDASQIYQKVSTLVNKDPLYHIWNEVKMRKEQGDPEAKFIVRMVNSRTRPLTHFFSTAIDNYYGIAGQSIRGSAS